MRHLENYLAAYYLLTILQLSNNLHGTMSVIPMIFLLSKMAMVIVLFSQSDSKVEGTKALIKECVLDINPPMLTIQGIGLDSAVYILAEFGDFSKFETPAQLLLFTGMEPGYFKSGTYESSENG